VATEAPLDGSIMECAEANRTLRARGFQTPTIWQQGVSGNHSGCLATLRAYSLSEFEIEL
jgi:L-asparaginase II